MARTNLVVIDRPAECRTCGATIGFIKSKKTGRFYPVDTLVDSATPDKQLVASPFAFHKCNPLVIAAFNAAKESSK